MSTTYAPSTLWVIYSCVNSLMIENNMPDLKHKPLIRKALKFKTDRWVAKMAEVFSPGDVHNVIVHFGELEDHKDRLHAVTILLLYYGLLRVDNSLKIKRKDLKLNKEGKFEVNFIYERKRFNSGFTYTIPKIYTHLITNKSRSSLLTSPTTSRASRGSSVTGMSEESSGSKIRTGTL